METQYLEERSIAGSQAAHLAADIAKHLRARQHLGKTVVICEKPVNLVSSVRKQWFKLARQLQRERSSTLNTEKILRLTAAVTHMHHMRFASKAPAQQPNAHVYFIRPDATTLLPDKLYNLYVVEPISQTTATHIFRQLPDKALIIDYTGQLSGLGLPFTPKKELEIGVELAWQKVRTFMAENHIDIENLLKPSANTHLQLDEALDTLLAISQRFLAVASSFQRTLELAQPVHLDLGKQQQYDILILLAHRVQALSQTPPVYRFTTSLSDGETFFLHDITYTDYSFADMLRQLLEYQHTSLTPLNRQLSSNDALSPPFNQKGAVSI